LLDTCVISEPLRKSPNPRLLQWWREQNELSLFLSTLVIGELEKGIQKLPASPRRETLLMTLESVIRQFESRVLPVDTAVGRRWGMLCAECERAGNPLPAVDGLIAATALTHDLVVVTRNVDDFAQSGVVTLNPFEL
jgi:predicted nucleic acid-binding protein